MKRVSDNIKNALKQPTTQRKGRILVDGSYYEVYNVEYYADTYLDGNVVGNAIASQLDFDLPYIEKFETFKYFDGVWTGDNYEYVDMGTFHVFDENDEDEFNKHITAFDNLIKFNDTFNDVGSYPKTLFQELQNICNQAGVGLENKSITNGDFIIENNQFVNGESLKTVLKAICQISGTYATIKNDELKLQLYNQTINKNIGTNEIRLKDAKESNALSYNIDGKCKQDGNPTPEAPVEIKTVKGIRNLFDKDNANVLTGYIHQSKSTIQASTSDKMIYIPCKSNTTYTVTKGLQTTTSKNRFKIATTNDLPKVGVNVYNFVNGGSDGTTTTNLTITTDENSKYIVAFIYANDSAMTLDELLSTIMIEEGSIAHDYVPYGTWAEVKVTNEDATQEKEVLIDLNKPNLFDKDNADILNGYFYDTSSSIISSTVSKCIYIPINGGNTYTVSKISGARFNVGTTTETPNIGTTLIDNAKHGNYTATNITLKTSSSANYLVVWFYASNADTLTEEEIRNSIKIYEGTEPFEYYELPSINDTKDILTIQNNQTTINKRIGKIVLDGSETIVAWGNTGGYSINIVPDGIYYESNQTIVNAICTHFKAENRNNVYYNSSDNIFSINAPNLFIRCNAYTTIANFKSWLKEQYDAGTPIIVYYELAEPETIQLTPTNVPLFEGYNNITLLEDLETNTSIEYESTIVENLDKSQHEPVLWKRKTYGINQVVLGMSDIEGEYVLRQDEDDIAKNGVHKLVINDNPFAYTQEKRNELIDDLFNQVRGFGYIPYEMNCEWFNYLEIGDKIVIDDINTLILRINGKSPNSLESMMSSPAIIDSSIKYIDNTNSIDNKLKRTEIIVDKQNQTINSLVNKIVDVSAEKSGTNSITLENAHEGQLHYLSIKGNISLLFPSSEENLYGYPLVPNETLTPSNNLVPTSPIPKDNKILYPSTELFSKSNALLIDDEEYKLDIDFLNYLNNTDCDEFIYDDGKCKIIRRLGVNESGELYKLENEIVEPREDIILNIKSDSTIKMKSFENVIFKVIYLLENEYTNYFATNVEVKSEINQTADEINLKVEQKLDGEEFTGANIMLQINKDESLAQINADKIDLSGKEINLTSDNISINSDDFKVTKDGEIEAKAGTIGGWNIDKTSLWGSIVPPKDYEESDYNRIHQILLGGITPTPSDYELYDFNKNGSIDSYDLLVCRKLIVYNIKKSNPAKLILDISDWFFPIKIINSSGERLVSFGPDGVFTKEIE